MPFHSYDYERLSKAASRLREERWRKHAPIVSFRTAEDTGELGAQPPAAFDAGELRTGDIWSGYDRYLWLDATVEVPQDFSGSLWGRFDFGITGGGGNSGFESLLYVDGHPYQGVDQNHQDVPLHAQPGQELHLQFRLWSGLVGGGRPHPNDHKVKLAELAILDEGVDSLYYWLLCLLGAHRMLEDNDPEKQRVLNLAVKAWDLVDTSDLESDAFFDSAARAVEFLEKEIPEEQKKVVVDLVGHTHIDTAWLWRLCHTHEKAARSFSTVNRLMDEYPDYIFLHTQPQQYDYIKHDYPEIFEHIRRRAAEGRWEPAGGMWVEADCNLISGESMVRQLLYGTRFFEKEFGNKSTYLWLPDVFGYSAALPQILKQSEIDTFITTKISWNDQNMLPYDTFEWRGIDGSSVITHFITTSSPGEHMYTYNGLTDAVAVKGVWNAYRNKELNTELLISYGYGDGGGGPNRDMIEQGRRIGRVPGMPGVRFGRVDEFCEKLHRTVEENRRHAYIPVWDGELYLEFHRGTYTSQAYNKKTNRRMEFLLRSAEEAVSRAMLRGADISAAREKLEKAWKTVLCLQFHDIIPGSSIREVYEDCHVMYGEAEALAREAMQEAAAADGAADVLTVWNNANWSREPVVELPADLAGRHVEFEDGTIPAQSGNAVAVPLPPEGTKKLLVRNGPAPAAEGCATVLAHGLETDALRLLWNQSGRLVSIYDKKAGRELVPEGQEANALTLYEDRPREYDAWELEYSHQRKPWELPAPVRVSIVENSAVRAVAEFRWTFRKSSLTQRMIVYPHKTRVDFVTSVEWNERETLMKVAFPTVLHSSRARFDIQFGSMERPTTKNTSWEYAKFESVGHKWADLSESGYGAALMNDSKYGYDVHDGVLRLTLLKSSNHPDYTADAGLQEFTYSLLLHEGEWYEANVDRESWELNDPPIVFQGSAQLPALFPAELPGVTFDAVKPAEDGKALILRLHEKEGRHTSVSIPTAFPFRSWCECNLLERLDGEAHSGKKVQLTLRPFELKTIKFVL